jgi:hypothetical protein
MADRVARTQIIQVANAFKLQGARRRGHIAKMFSRRHINQAVAVCRQNGLVEAEVMRDAGFNA